MNAAIARTPSVCECGDHAWVNLTRWGVTLADPEYLPLLGRWSWCLYGRRNAPYARCKKESLHRMVSGAEAGQIVDHINHNGLDNRKANLRVGTPALNNANFRKKRAPSSSRFKGVSSIVRMNDVGWYARIKVAGRCHHLGIFDVEEEAAAAYDAAAVKHFGEFAMTNEKMSLL